MPAIDLMLDLETLGISAGCPIIAIGVCSFDLRFQFYEKISPDDGRLHFKENIETLRWWNKQDHATRAEAFSGTQTTLEALNRLGEWLGQFPKRDIQIWGNGADFDLPILGAAYDKFDIPHPWGAYSGRCYRTLKSLLPHISAPVKNNQKHNALEDAIFQAQHAVSLFQAL